ncbi:uncharacterized protein LOC122855828 [Aphidius gifuensis]|uniref:uncharacterized protein LOC122855828 n=1 Tax=Aphidius gifuensis TaxID=684658 RepID=UPI001CDCDAFB|nr:uncharacterized protein LOC122855828 [Aphidius gifuensis]
MESPAVYLDLTTDYSTEGFLAAFKRFVGRRGRREKLFSDCGTNFVSADAESKRHSKSASKEAKDLATLLARDGTNWGFTPPGSPHSSGKWESVVRSAKHHFKRVIGDHKFTYEHFRTFLTQVECLLNSRPSFPMTDDPEDLQALTPGHFLVGELQNAVPKPSVLDVPDNRLNK